MAYMYVDHAKHYAHGWRFVLFSFGLLLINFTPFIQGHIADTVVILSNAIEGIENSMGRCIT